MESGTLPTDLRGRQSKPLSSCDTGKSLLIWHIAAIAQGCNQPFSKIVLTMFYATQFILIS